MNLVTRLLVLFVLICSVNYLHSETFGPEYIYLSSKNYRTIIKHKVVTQEEITSKIINTTRGINNNHCASSLTIIVNENQNTHRKSNNGGNTWFEFYSFKYHSEAKNNMVGYIIGDPEILLTKIDLSEILTYEIFEQNGSIVKQNLMTLQVDYYKQINDLKYGIYLIKYTFKNGNIVLNKFLKY